MPRGRLLKLALIVSLSVAVVGGIVLWGLPAMIRWFAISQIATHTGRATTIDDVRLNPFTGRLSVRRLRLAERDGAQTFVEVPRLEMRFVPSALWRSHIRLADVSLVAPVARVVRAKSGELNVSDLVSALTRPAGSPSRWAVTVDRLAISNGTVHAHDEAVTPSSTWSVRTLDLELLELTTRAGAKPGSGTVRGRIDEATLDLTVERLRLDPLAAIVQIALHGFELRRLGPYMSHAGARYRVHGGRLAAALSATVDHKGEELTKAALSGTVSVENETVARAGHDETFLDIPRAAIHVKEADAMTRSLSLSSVVIEGATLRARRDRQGVIDIFDIFRQAARDDVGPRVSGAAPAPTVSRRLVAAVGSLAHGFDRIHIERILLGPSTVTLVDESVTPLTTLSLSRMQTTIRDFTWPATHAAALTLSAMLPGGGTIEITGLLGLQPFEAQLATVVRDAPIDPYQAYMPGAARFRGRVSGDSRSHIAAKDDTMLLVSKGSSWAVGVEVRAPGANRPAIRVERLDVAGIDLDWPRRARVAKLTLRRPNAEIVREADGSFDVASVVRAPAPRRDGRKGNGRLETLKLDVNEVRVEDGFVRFLDRTTSPAFSKDMSQLSVVVNNLGNRPGQRARLAATAIVGGDSAVDLHGELGAIGAPASIDLVGDLRGMQLASVNPYAEHGIGWVVKNGDLDYKLHFTLDAHELEATNEIALGQLRVAPSGGTDWVRQQIGVPLTLLVALAKDGRGEIRVTVPVSGSIWDPQFELRRVMSSAVRSAIARLIRNPFRAISRSLRDTDTIEVPTVDPVTFAPGSSVIDPEMEQHLLRVADVLRRKPFVNLTLAPAPGSADVEVVKAETLSMKLGASLLREREPTPEALLGELSQRRVDATRQQLTSVEGIPAGRLAIAAPTLDIVSPSAGPGRVELSVVAGE